MKKVFGIILLVLCGLSVLGSLGNGTYSMIGVMPVSYYIGFFGAQLAMLIGGIALLVSSKKNKKED